MTSILFSFEIRCKIILSYLSEEKEKAEERRKEIVEKATGSNTTSNAKPGSLAAKANMVRDFNERNSRK